MKRITTIIIVIAALFGVALFFLSPEKHDAKADSSTTDAVSVKTVTLIKKNIPQRLEQVATVQAVHEVELISEAQGKITKVYAEVGAYLRQGAPVVHVDATLKEAAFLTAKVKLEKAKKDVERYESLRGENNLSENDVEQARLALQSAEADYKLAARDLANCTIRTPIAGFLAERTINFGAMLSQGAKVGTVVDIASLKLVVMVNEAEAARLQVGDKVSVSTPLEPDLTLDGTIKTIGLKADAAHNFPIEVRLPNRKTAPLRAGQTARVQFALPSHSALVIPRTALASGTLNPAVFIAQNGTAVKRDVTIGKQFDTDVEILQGVSEGEIVITAGINNLVGGEALTVK
jgi:RND family efflux transporter MFP subunit